MEIFKPGTLVRLMRSGNQDSLPAVVLKVMVEGPELAVSYSVAFWEKTTRTEVWVQSHEVKGGRDYAGPTSKPLGFKFRSDGVDAE